MFARPRELLVFFEPRIQTTLAPAIGTPVAASVSRNASLKSGVSVKSETGSALIQRRIVKRGERGEDRGSEGILAVDQIQGEDAPRATGSTDSRSRELIDHVAQFSTLEYVTRNYVRQDNRPSSAETPTRPVRDRRPCLQ